MVVNFDAPSSSLYDWGDCLSDYNRGVMATQIEKNLHHTLNDLLLMHIAIDKFVMARHGLRRVRFYILRHLYENPGISITRLSELSFADTASISRMITGLEKKGLVQRETSEEDRRLFVLSLTATGKAKYEAANADLQADIHQRFVNIAPDMLADILQKTQLLAETILQHLMDQQE